MNRYLHDLYVYGSPEVTFFPWSPPAPAFFAELEELTPMSEIMEKWGQQVLEFEECLLTEALAAILGRPPVPADLVGRAMKMQHPDGTIDYTYDGTLILQTLPDLLPNENDPEKRHHRRHYRAFAPAVSQAGGEADRDGARERP